MLLGNETKTINAGEYSYTLKVVNDDGAEPPWEAMNGLALGWVTGWESDMLPGYKVLNSDGGCSRFYDYQGARTKAEELGEPLDSVDREYEYFKAWCEDDWWYVGVMVTNNATGKTESLYGIESNTDTAHINGVFSDLLVEHGVERSDCTTPWSTAEAKS